MSLAKLSIDLVANLSKFEADFGKAATIVAKDSERMTKAGAAFIRSLERMQERARGMDVDFLRVKGAELGLSETTEKLIAKIDGFGGAATRASSASAVAFSAIGASVEGVTARQKANVDELVAGINRVTAEAARLKASAIGENKAGRLSDDQLKVTLGNVSAGEQDAIRQLKAYADQERATLALAAADEAATAKRRAALSTLTQSLNGVTAAYRKNLEVLQESLSKGDITPKQFQTKLGALNEQQNPAILALRAEQAAAKKAADEVVAQAKRKADAETKSAEAFAAAVNKQANAIGKLPSQLLAEEAALRGVTAQTQAAIAKMAEFERKTGQAGKGAFATANQLQTLRYTISDIVASAGSGISPFTILLQQGPQLAQVEGGISGIFKTILSLATPARLAIGGLGGAVGGLAYAWYQGHAASKEFNDSVVLSGNYAGITEGRYNSMAKAIAASGEVQLSAAREAGQALIATGQVGPENIEKATEATARFAAATGKTAKEVATDFAGMSNGVVAWATEHNKQLNFLSAAQLQQIKRFEEQGRAADAQGIVYDALNVRLRGLEPNLGTLEKTLRAVTNTWGKFWDAALDVGRAETIEDKISKVEARLARFAESQKSVAKPGEGFNPNTLSSAPPTGPREAEQAARELAGLRRIKGEQIAAAAVAAETAELNKKGAESSEYVSGFLKRAKSVEALNKALAEADRHFAVQKRLGTPVSDANQNSIRAQIREDFNNRPGASEADAQRKSQLAKDLQVFVEQLAKESDALKFHQAELQAIYAAGGISLKAFSDERRKTTEADVQAQLDAQIKASNRLRAELARGAFKDPHQKTDTEKQLAESVSKEANLRRDAAHAVVLANYEEAASFRQLGERVAEFLAQTKQLSGDEAGAAQLRTLAAIAKAQEQARQSGGLISPEELAAHVQALQNLDKLAEAQRQLGFVTANAARTEEILALQQAQRGAGLIESEREVFGARSRALEQLVKLRDAMTALGNATDDPRTKQIAADLALQVAKAAETIDPAIQRLREAGSSLASSISGSVGSAITDFKSLPDLAKNIVKSIEATFVKLSITDPIEKQMQASFRGLSEGEGALAGFFKKVLGLGGAGESVKVSAEATAAAATANLSAQTTSASFAITTMSAAADAATSALLQLATSGGGGGFGSAIASLMGSSGPSGSYADNPFQAIGFAEGTDRVPRTGMYKLHKDERVQPAKYNPALDNRGGGGGNVSVIVNAPPGTTVDRKEERETSSGREIEVFLSMVEQRVAGGIGNGSVVDRAIRNQYGVSRAPGLPRRT